MEIFNIQNLAFTYPEARKSVLRQINLSIHRGDFLLVFGESGSGKTTLLKLLKRELTPHGKREGQITYKGQALETLDERVAASEIAYVLQDPDPQIVTDKVWHELAFGLENLGLPSPVIRRRVSEIANYFGIHTWYHKKTTDLSGGQKQLLNLAAVLVMEPEVLILDEPSSQLDPIAARNLLETLKKINEELGLTIIIVEHRLEDLLPMVDRVIVLEEGEILANTSPDKIGSQLSAAQDHPMFEALPTPVKLYYRLGMEGRSPLTVKEGRQFISQHFQPSRQPKKLDKVHSHHRSSPLLEVKNAWFRYERKLPDVLKGVNVQIYENEVVSILGGNGSGKTTLLNVMAGLRKCYRGKVSFKNKKIQAYKSSELYRAQLAVLAQDPTTMFIKETVRRDYQDLLNLIDQKERAEEKIQSVAQELEIEALLDRHPFDLSGGEIQKCALGKLLLRKPQLMLLDEPTKGLDSFYKRQLATLIQELKKAGLTLVIVTHDVEFAATISDRVGLFFDGELLTMEPPVEFFSTNHYYTTAASRMSRHIFDHVVTYEALVDRCIESGVLQ